MPGASGCGMIAGSAIVRRLHQRTAEHALDLARAAGRRDAAASAPRNIRRWWIRRRPRPRRRRRSGRSARRGRSAHGRPWSARHGPTDWPMAPPPARRTRAGSPARPGARGPGSRPCRARRWRGRPPRNRRFWATPASAGPARTPRPAPAPWHRSGRSAARRARSPTWAISGLKAGPALGLIEPRDGGRIGGIGAEAVDGLGRERDQAALGQAIAPRRPRRPRLRAKICVFRPTFTGIGVLNSASCGVRNPRL